MRYFGLISAALVLGGAIAIACGSDDSTGGPDSGTDGTSGSGGSGTGGSGTGGSGGTGTGGTGGMAGSGGSGGSAGSMMDSGPDAPVMVSPNDVLGFHKNPNRDGFYVDKTLTKAAIGTMKPDPGFKATTSAKTYAQPLFMEAAIGGKDVLFVATEGNDVYALDAATGAQIWTQTLGTPVPLGAPLCGGSQDINPIGVTGTPVIDPVARLLFATAFVKGAAGLTFITYALSIDTGMIKWKVDLGKTIPGFTPDIQYERGAMALVAGNVYVPFGGLDGDCGDYKGWVVSIPENNPTAAKGFQTPFKTGPGIWGVSGVASDGTSLFVATCNTNSPFTQTWDQAYSEGILRLGTDLSFSKAAADYFAPTDWYTQDTQDTDFGSSGVVLFDAPGASHTKLAFGIGKTSTARLVDRTNMGGISDGLSNLADNSGQVFAPLFAYTTAKGTYVGGHMTFNGCAGGDFSVLKVDANSQLQFAWCAASGGEGGPISSSTMANGSSDSIVWSFGSNGDNTLRAWDADTGAAIPIANGVAPNGSTGHWTSPLIAKGRVYMAGNGTVYAFKP